MSLSGVLHGSARLLLPAIGALALLAAPHAASAFPPYRSTDADTAHPWTVEGRLGLLQLEREGDDTAYASPLVRLNFGLPKRVEILSEFEYAADEGRVADAALGMKWIPIMRTLSVGVENLLLLPVSDKTHGAGVESVLLATLWQPRFRVHLNAGGFYDARADESETGWKVGAILEFLSLGRARPGLEVFARRAEKEPTEVAAGPGVIIDVGCFDVRAGVRGGLTDAAPDFTFTFWLTSKLPFRGERGRLDELDE